MNLDTLSSDSSEEEIRDSGTSFQSLIVWGKNRNNVVTQPGPQLELPKKAKVVISFLGEEAIHIDIFTG